MTGRTATRGAWGGARVVALAVIAALLAAPLLITVSGRRLVVVDGGSMSPTFERGDVVITSKPTGHDLVVGQPVLVGTGSTTYLHRVIERDDDRAKLQGDANATPDPGWVTPADVSGTVAVHLGPPWSSMVTLLTSWPAKIALVGALVLLFRFRRDRHRASPNQTDFSTGSL